MTDRIKNRVYIVTGASSGVGRDVARSLASHGAVVYAVARRLPEVMETDAGKLIPVSVDITKAEQIGELSKKIAEDGNSPVYGLINCVGGGLAGMLSHTDTDELRHEFEVNVFGTMEMIHTFVPQMEGQGAGVVINIGSIGGELPLPYQGTYSMTKAAIRRATDVLRLELDGCGVEACCIEPGDLRTGFTAARKYSKSTLSNDDEKRIVLGSVGRMARDEQEGKGPECVTALLLKLLKRRHLPPKATVGGWYEWIPLLQHLVPYWLQEKIIRMMYM